MAMQLTTNAYAVAADKTVASARRAQALLGLILLALAVLVVIIIRH